MRSARRKIRFTKQAIQALEPAEKRFYVHDDEQRGLVLAVQPTGVKAFYLYRWVDAKPERVRLGGWPDLTVEQARRLARSKIGNIADGSNPADDRRKRRAEITIAEAWESFITHTKEHRRPNTAREYQRQFDAHLKPWGNRPLRDVQRADVKLLVDRIGREAPYMANRVLATTRRLFNYAAETFDYTGENPTKHVKRFPEQSRERFLDENEIAAFLAAVDAEPDQTWKDFFKLALFTGARRSNLQAMKWDDLDLAGNAWTVPADQSKNGREMRIMLVPEAVAVLNERRKSKGKKTKSPFVFPGRGSTGHVTEPKKAWATLLERAGLKNLRVHDLRRSLGSWAAIAGGSLLHIGKALGHRSPQSTAIYARLSDAPVRETVGKAVEAMIAAAGKKKEGSGIAEAKAS